ncbi:hypothetical protein jhhlp_003704 [Lomentospora prolificans]|uniref:DUF1774-domain-containing protein n=1 Tax=Lomentospora prolificans TaxID=41688 RepID=A0A2N3N9H9_9PEZI|nr:hypothetical protein jhhlp_003704 [Lomentospora prolificans]
MVDYHAWNPFAKRETHTAQSITTYKVLTLLTLLLTVLTSVYYTVDEPRDGFTIRRRIWDLNDLYPTGFTLNPIIASIYWILVFLLQIGYVTQLFSNDAARVTTAANVGSHFILNNILHFAFVMLFVRSHFVWAEVIQVINFFNLLNLYFLHRTSPLLIHIPVASAPLAWAFVALYWNGALTVHHPNHFVGRVFANIFIWSIPVFGHFCLLVFNDYTIGFALSILSAALGVGQFFHKVIALQWIFAFVSMATLFVSSSVVASRAWARRETTIPADQERAPLLNDEN